MEENVINTGLTLQRTPINTRQQTMCIESETTRRPKRTNLSPDQSPVEPTYVKMAESNDVIFLCETWHNEGEKKIKEFESKAKTHFKTAMENKIKGGRPNGGIGWLIKKHSKISYVEFENFIIIGVFLASNDSTQKSLNEHLYDIVTLENLILNSELQQFKV
ncbi:hypothetical protein BpHYR1_006406 [Brachionus plicatilis]|uniref:RNA-directed DNA polymerase from mobile element jockey-like n=1 Tax=Brachionus plicatilis TaxID=10195 RepID=A0A3M7SHI1_BRAPC|nr:hypothetical protein BpHYR1_006406 [Brachionus plicatilis]